MTFIAFNKTNDFANFIANLLFFPLFVYFFNIVLPEKQKSLIVIKPKTTTKTSKKLVKKSTLIELPTEKIQKEQVEEGEIDDIDRRVFLKIIASAGAGLFLMTLFSRKTEAAFFGSAPQPSTLKLRDSQGNIINPAEKSPTDGFRITEIDDSSTPAYYGFVNKNGNWFIMKEESTGSYRYTKGNSDFSDAWNNRTSLTYSYFDEVF